MHTATTSIKVWDPIVRIGHWTLVIAFFTAYFTEEDYLTQHVWAGYVVVGIVLFRIIWGMIGTKHARFSDFIYRPAAIFGYLKGLIHRKPQHYLGHNPAGGAMVVALLLSICVTVYSGLVLYAVEKHAGPLASFYANNTNVAPAFHVISNANAEDQDTSIAEAPNPKSEVNKQDEEFWEGLHEFFANLTLLLVAVHVAGVILSSFIDKENLVKAMITGRKDRNQ